MVNIYHIFFICLSVDGHLGSLYSLAIVDIAAINIRVQVPLRITTFVSLGKYPVVQLLGRRVALFFWGCALSLADLEGLETELDI